MAITIEYAKLFKIVMAILIVLFLFSIIDYVLYGRRSAISQLGGKLFGGIITDRPNEQITAPITSSDDDDSDDSDDDNRIVPDNSRSYFFNSDDSDSDNSDFDDGPNPVPVSNTHHDNPSYNTNPNDPNFNPFAAFYITPQEYERRLAALRERDVAFLANLERRMPNDRMHNLNDYQQLANIHYTDDQIDDSFSFEYDREGYSGRYGLVDIVNPDGYFYLRCDFDENKVDVYGYRPNRDNLNQPAMLISNLLEAMQRHFRLRNPINLSDARFVNYSESTQYIQDYVYDWEIDPAIAYRIPPHLQAFTYNEYVTRCQRDLDTTEHLKGVVQTRGRYSRFLIKYRIENNLYRTYAIFVINGNTNERYVLIKGHLDRDNNRFFVRNLLENVMHSTFDDELCQLCFDSPFYDLTNEPLERDEGYPAPVRSVEYSDDNGYSNDYDSDSDDDNNYNTVGNTDINHNNIQSTINRSNYNRSM